MISASSLERMTRSTVAAARAAAIARASSDRPATARKFFRARRFEPPRAVMRASTERPSIMGRTASES